MNVKTLESLEVVLNSVEIPSIGPDVNFWMIRSKGGYFYKEYITKQFIALGWNYIDKSTSFQSDNLSVLKDGIKERYGDKVPQTSINKCRKFIEDVKEGDYLIIPNARSTEITIGIVGEYYEEETLDYLTEVITIKKIDNNEFENGSVECPYKKRRNIKVLISVSGQRIGYKLSKAISSYHGLSCLNDYAKDILNCVYNCYEFNDNLIYAINIAKKGHLKLRELSSLLLTTTELFSNIIDEDLLSVSINLNSPGKMEVNMNGGYKKIKKLALPLVLVYVFLFGGSGFGFEFSGVKNDLINTIKEVKMMNIDIARAEAELEGIRLDNYKKTLDLINACNSESINIEKVIDDLEEINNLKTMLQLESNEEFAIVEEQSEEIEEDTNKNLIIENPKE